MKVLRTPDECFVGLPDFDFEPHYATCSDEEGGVLRVHYLDEGPVDGAPVLLMHGEPSWSFLYRHMIPVLSSAGARCIAPDLVGFGRSDKPASTTNYSYARHVRWMAQLVFEQLDLHEVTLVAQDWGGLIGLRLLGADPQRFARVVLSNTGLPTGTMPVSEAFLAWQRYAAQAPSLPIGRIVASGCTSELSSAVIAAYDAPFPDDTYKAGARIFPALVPTSPEDPAHAENVATWEVLSRFHRPLVCAFSDHDPITAGGDAIFRRKVPGAAGQDHVTIAGAGHFVQEDKGPELAAVVVKAITGS